MNEPYQRISKDNGVWEGALIGAGIGAASSGAVVGQSAWSYRGIPKRAQRDAQILQEQKPFFDQFKDNANARYNRKMDKADKGLFGRNASEARENKRIDRATKRFTKDMNRVDQYYQDLKQVGSAKHIEGLQNNHRYSKHMGGWKNLGIIGASAIIGGGLGMITGELTN